MRIESTAYENRNYMVKRVHVVSVSPPTHTHSWVAGLSPRTPPATPLFSWQCVGATQEYLLVRISNLLAVSSL